ncbi:MAG: hypothetical protein JJ953_14045 [Gracilimonas sp.]|nr:O-antigen ligase family protein [Gracilimonas sp.]MBO6587227.1 hypothetical protein [Gracilimonas sp.]MBO6614285.1 hypothetical protein [Gracilimonas sp.]
MSWATGSVYISASISLIILLCFARIKKSSLLLFIVMTILLTVNNFFAVGPWNYFEYIQMLGLLFVFMFFRVINSEIGNSIYRGFNLGSYLITLGFILLIAQSNPTQEDYRLFSVSGTYNYTSFYIYFGFIIAPYVLEKRLVFRILDFLIFIMLTYFFATRSILVLGTLSYFILNLSIKNKSLAVVNIILLIFSLSFIVSPDVYIDLFYSITNFSTDTSNIYRLGMFHLSFESVWQNEFGWGIGNSATILSNSGFPFPHAHNTLANWLLDFGLAGFLLYFSFIVYIIKLLFSNKSKVAFIVTLFLIAYSNIDALQYNILVSMTTIITAKSISKI